jgi:hypothetical protein
MPKQTASAPRPDPSKAPGKKRSRSVAKASAEPMQPATRIPSHGEISALAYSLYAERGFRAGDAVQDWLHAERRLREG